VTEQLAFDDIVLGRTVPLPGHVFAISPAEQAYHSLVWGSTGAGKSKFLATQLLQHISRHHAVCLLDPHGDLAEDCLRGLASGGFFSRPDAYERLVYIDFSDTHHAPFNILGLKRFRPHVRAQNALDAFGRTWPEVQSAPHFRTLFLTCAMILIAADLPLTDINRLLLDGPFRGACLARVSDPFVRQLSGYFEKGLQGAAGSTLRRSFLLGFDPVLRGCLAQKGNIFDIRQMMDWGVSLIINLGSIQQLESRRLMGSLLMVQIEQAALSRAEMPQSARRPWTCFVDEWPQMAATQGASLDNLLTQARKYNLRLCLAGQSPAQIEAGRLAGALEQCRLSVTFRLGADSATRQAREIAYLDLADAETSASAQMRQLVQTIQNLPAREAFVKVAGEEPVRIRTLDVSDPTPGGELEEIVAQYRRRYQTRATPEALPFEGSLPPLGGGDVARIETLLAAAGGPVADFASYFGENGDDTYDDAP